MNKEPKPEPDPNRKKHTNWGGRRPGAGAPKGNMNALKHGRRSQQMATLLTLLIANHKTHRALSSIAERWQRDTSRPKKSPPASSPRSSSAASSAAATVLASPAHPEEPGRLEGLSVLPPID